MNKNTFCLKKSICGPNASWEKLPSFILQWYSFYAANYAYMRQTIRQINQLVYSRFLHTLTKGFYSGFRSITSYVFDRVKLFFKKKYLVICLFCLLQFSYFHYSVNNFFKKYSLFFLERSFCYLMRVAYK